MDKHSTEFDVFVDPSKLLYRKALYRVDQRTMPVEFFFNFYTMLQDISLKIGTDYPQVLSYDKIRAWNIDSALVSVKIKIIVTSSMLKKTCHILYVHEFDDFYFS